MSENTINSNSIPKSSGEKVSPKHPMALGANQPLLLWISTKVESTANLREHWTHASKRKQLQREAVKKAVAGILPPKVPEESEGTS